MVAKQYKHIVWDWNGTLLDDAWLCVEVLNDLLMAAGRPRVTIDDYRLHFGFPVIDYYRHLGFDTSQESFQAVSERFIAAYEERWLTCNLHPGAKALLSELNAEGITQSVLSAAKQEALDFGIRHFGLADQFVGLVGLDNILAHGKIDLGRRWIESQSLDPAEVLLVGDTLHDHEVADAMNVNCLLLTHGHHVTSRLEQSGMPVIHSFDELRSHLFASA